MNLLKLFGVPADETTNSLTALADKLVPKKLPACVANLHAAYELRRNLQLVSEVPGVSRETVSAARPRLQILDALIVRMQIAGMMRASALRLSEDRKRCEGEQAAARQGLAVVGRELADLAPRVQRAEERLSALKAERDAKEAAIAAERAAAEQRLRAAIQAGDERTEESAALDLAQIGPDKTWRESLAVRIDETERVLAGLVQARNDCRARQATLAGELNMAATLAAAIESDAAMNRLSVALFDLIVQRASTRTTHPAVDSRYGFGDMVLKIHAAGRAWFADSTDADNPAVVRIEDKLERLRRALTDELPDLAVLAQPLPGVADVRAAAVALM